MRENYKNKRRLFIKNAAAASVAAISFPAFASAFNESPKGAAADGKGFTFLFQGDSITDGNRTRNTDWNHVMGHGYAYIIASKLGYNQPEKEYQFFNRGISGNKITDLENRWQTDTLDIKPDVLSVLIGVNDVNSVISKKEIVDAVRFEEGYSDILQQTKTALPSVQLVICEPFLLPVGRVKDNWDAWSMEMKKYQQAASQLAVSFNAIYVPLQAAFNKACDKVPPEYWIWDGVHPMPAGHELIAVEWMKTVKKELGFIKL